MWKLDRSNFPLLPVPVSASVMYVCAYAFLLCYFWFVFVGVCFNGLILKDYFPHWVSCVGNKSLSVSITEFRLQTEFPVSAFIQMLYADKELEPK